MVHGKTRWKGKDSISHPRKLIGKRHKPSVEMDTAGQTLVQEGWFHVGMPGEFRNARRVKEEI
jgi:hypothetical protein